jgi:hypothetical protein
VIISPGYGGIIADTGVFDTSQGTVHLVLGCGGTNANLDDYGTDTADGHPTTPSSRLSP